MDLTQVESELKRIEAERDKLLKQASDLLAQITALRVERVWMKWKIRIGSIVDVSGTRFKVTGFRYLDSDGENPPWAQGCKATKGGGWSQKEQCLYSDWKVVEEGVAP